MPPFLSKLKYFDTPLQVVSGLLLIAGLTIMYGTSLSGGNLQIFYRQLFFAVIGIVLYFLLAFYDYHKLAKLNRLFYPILIGLLAYVLFFTRAIKGSTRWIDIGFFNFQPAEFAKIVIILGLARWLYLKRGQINSWKNILITFAYTAIPGFLILKEPDLGSAIILFGTWLGILMVSPMNKKYLIAFAIFGLVLAGVGWKFVLKDYQKNRIEVFLNPSLDPRGQGYNVRQATIAVGSGQLWGKGLGKGLQSQLNFLPERQTDFIFASASEEIGFIGCITIVGLYSYLCVRLLFILKSTKDDLGMYIVAGVLFMLFGQALINIGMNIGLLPVTGIPLPLLSYGGSSLLVVMISLGIVQNIARQSKQLRF